MILAQIDSWLSDLVTVMKERRVIPVLFCYFCIYTFKDMLSLLGSNLEVTKLSLHGASIFVGSINFPYYVCYSIQFSEFCHTGLTCLGSTKTGWPSWSCLCCCCDPILAYAVFLFWFLSALNIISPCVCMFQHSTCHTLALTFPALCVLPCCILDLFWPGLAVAQLYNADQLVGTSALVGPELTFPSHILCLSSLCFILPRHVLA